MNAISFEKLFHGSYSPYVLTDFYVVEFSCWNIFQRNFHITKISQFTAVDNPAFSQLTFWQEKSHEQWLYPSMWVHALKGVGGERNAKEELITLTLLHPTACMPTRLAYLVWTSVRGEVFFTNYTHCMCSVNWTMNSSSAHSGSHDHKRGVTWAQVRSHDHKWGSHEYKWGSHDHEWGSHEYKWGLHDHEWESHNHKWGSHDHKRESHVHRRSWLC